MIRSIILLNGIFLMFNQAFGQSHFPIEKLDSFISRTMYDWHTMGVAIAIVSKDSIWVNKGYGYRDYALKLPVTGQTIFPIASCSKTFTAALMLKAAMENKLDLEKPVNGYLPEFQLYRPGLTRQATVTDLLSHRTGLAAHDWAWTFNTNFKEDVYLKRIKYLEPFAELRTKFEYSNFMFFVLSALSTRLYHKSWDALTHEKLFQPLEMKNTYSSRSTLMDMHNIALTYSYQDSFQLEETRQMDDLMGAGSLNSNTEDLATWLRMWIRGGTFKNKTILDQKWVRKAISPHILADEGLPDQYPDEHFKTVGLAWFLSSYRGHFRANHNGNVAGFSSSLTFFPYDSIGIVVLTNQNNSSLIRLIPDFVADIMFQLPVRDKNSSLLARREAYLKSAPKPVFINPDTIRTKPTLKLSHYSGKFENPGYGPARIDPYVNSLLLTYYDLKLVLLPLGGNRFSSHYFEADKIEANGVGEVLFKVNNRGTVYSFAIPFEPSVKDIVFTRY